MVCSSYHFARWPQGLVPEGLPDHSFPYRPTNHQTDFRGLIQPRGSKDRLGKVESRWQGGMAAWIACVMSMSRCGTIPQFLGDRRVSTSNCVFCSLLKSVPIHRYLLTFYRVFGTLGVVMESKSKRIWAWLQNGGRLFAPRTPPPWGFRELSVPFFGKRSSSKSGRGLYTPLRLGN